MIKTILIHLAKFAFAATLIIFLLKSDRLDFKLIYQVFDMGWRYPVAILLLAFQAILTARRWKYILDIKIKGETPMFSMIKLTWIGLMFSSILPGAVTGDLIKLVYAKDLSKKLTRSFLVTSALLDRIFGLIGLLSLLGLFTLFNYKTILQMTSLGTELISLNILLLCGCLGFIFALFAPQKIKQIILKTFSFIPLIGEKLIKLMEDIWTVGECKKTIFKTISLSFVSQLANVMAFWILTSPFYPIELPLKMLFTFIPLGLVTVAIPVAPAGIGVGHMAFESLFQMMGVKGGASFFNLFFISNIFLNLTGIIPYLFSKKKHSFEETKDF